MALHFGLPLTFAHLYIYRDKYAYSVTTFAALTHLIFIFYIYILHSHIKKISLNERAQNMIINVHQTVEPQAPPPQYEPHWHYLSQNHQQEQNHQVPGYNFQNTRAAAENFKRVN